MAVMFGAARQLVFYCPVDGARGPVQPALPHHHKRQNSAVNDTDPDDEFTILNQRLPQICSQNGLDDSPNAAWHCSLKRLHLDGSGQGSLHSVMRPVFDALVCCTALVSLELKEPRGP